MAERQRGMGRGLAAILSVAPRDEPEELRQLPPELISPNPLQPRQVSMRQSLLALAESIRLRGVLQPVLVRPLPGGTTSWSPASAAGGPPSSPSSRRSRRSSATTTTPPRWRSR